MVIRKSNLSETFDMSQHVRESNLIEGVDSAYDDRIAFNAWRWLSQQKRLNRDVVMRLHAIIMAGKLHASDTGQHRRVDVWIGGNKAPAPYNAVHMFSMWITDMRSWKKLDPKEMHVKFEHIHPFIDGNGRVGRMIMWWHEMMLGQEPTLIEFEKRRSYYDWFSEDES